MNNRIQDVLTSISEVRVQFEQAASPLEKLDAYDRLQTLRAVLELECELELDQMLAKGVA